MSEQQRRKKLLNKYIGSVQNKKKNKISSYQQNVWMKDDEDILQRQSSESSQQQIQITKKARIQSSDQDQNQDNDRIKKQNLKQKLKKKQQKASKKQRKLKKKIRKALGLQNDQQIDEFLNNLQVQGIQKQEILEYLKINKQAIIKKEVTNEEKQSKKKKKKDKKQQKQSQHTKFKMFQKSQSSDLQIPQQARAKTIYRNKDGTIRQTSQKQQKQKHKQAVLARLAQWEKGMKKQQNNEQKIEHEDIQHVQNNNIWNDPMKRWQSKLPQKLLICKFEGPPNRYNIKPGFRWDGVIRGNGFENRYLQEINLKKAKKDKEHMDYMKDL